jgi:hypothetical protein
MTKLIVAFRNCFVIVPKNWYFQTSMFYQQKRSVLTKLRIPLPAPAAKFNEVSSDEDDPAGTITLMNAGRATFMFPLSVV